jgi:Putative arginyl-tRNA:protein arginylyltransferase
MDQDDPEAYLKFLTSPWGDTTFYEFRLSGKLLAVAVLDRLKNALSAVYTFFDPDHDARSLGTYAILWEIHEAQRLGLSWLYLGYWIKESPKMAYKNEFRPYDAYQNSRWLRIE